METSCCRAAPSQDLQRSYSGHYMDAGRNAEMIVMKWLRQRPSIIGIDDLRNLKAMREADVDASVRLYDGRIALVEIKSDWHLGVSGNILFEVLRINHTCSSEASCTLGWSARSPAKWLLFYAPQIDAIYMITFNDYRKGMQKFTRDVEPNKHIITVRTDAIKTTLNLLIPETYIQGLKVYEINNGKGQN